MKKFCKLFVAVSFFMAIFSVCAGASGNISSDAAYIGVSIWLISAFYFFKNI